MKRFLCVVVCSLLALSGYGNPAFQHEKYGSVYSYANDWMVYDYDDKVYLPYVGDQEKKTQTYSLEINLREYNKTYLVIKTPEVPTNIFIENTLRKVSRTSEWLAFDMAQLHREFGKDKVFVSFFTSAVPSEIVAYAGYPAEQEKIISEKSGVRDIIRLLPRSVSKFNSGIALAFLMGVVLLSFVSSNYIRVFYKYFSFRDVFSTKVKDDLFMIGKPMDRPSLIFVIFLSVIGGFVILLLQYNNYVVLDNNYLFQSGNTFGVYIINFFKLCLVMFIVYVVKYFYLNLVGKLFNLGKITDIHYFKVIQSSLLFLTLLLLVILVAYNLYIPLPQGAENYMFIGLMAFYIARGFLIYFTINRESNVQILYLFSYLCIAEALPTILVTRFLF